jgi:hypothetical protein
VTEVSESIPGDPDRDTGEGDERAEGGSSYDRIAKRAYEIFESGEGGTAEENWKRAERELRGSPAAS